MTRRGLVLPMLFASSVACSPNATPTKTAETPACETTLRSTDPVLPKPETPAPRPSRIVVELRAPVDRLERLLARSVPSTLAQSDHQPIGSAGVAKYRVQHGAFSVALAGDRLVVSTPIHIHIEVSKGFGPFTIDYGRCDPELLSTVSVPLRLTPDFHLDPPTVTTKLTRGCTIAVVDVSGEIQAEARRQSASLERELRVEIARIPELARAAFAPMTLPLAKSGCARFQAQRFEYELPRLEHGTLLTRIGLVGDLELAPDCTVPNGRPQDVEPTAAVVEQLDSDSALVWQRGWRYPDFGRALSVRPPSADGTRVRAVLPRPVRVEGASQVALRLDLEGRTCGPLWTTATPVVRAGAVGFSGARVGSPSEAARGVPVSALAGELSATFPPSIRHELDGVSEDLGGLVTTALALARGQTTVKAEITNASASIADVVAGPEELRVVLEYRARAVAELE